jgi:hypothetical protein
MVLSAVKEKTRRGTNQGDLTETGWSMKHSLSGGNDIYDEA